MPNFVKSTEDKRLWKKATVIADKNGHQEDWPYITGVFQKMKGSKMAAILTSLETVQNLVGKTVASVDIADFDGVADVTMVDGSMVFIHTPPPGANAIQASMINDAYTVLDLKGHQVSAVEATDWDPHIVNLMFDNGSVVALHTDGDAKLAEEKIPGGMAKDKKPEDFDPDALAKGQKVEMEHTDDPNVALEITMDHLMESDKYYTELEKMENKLEKKAHDLADRFIREGMGGDPEKRLAQRYLSKKAATIQTDTSSVYVLSGEHLEKILEAGELSSALIEKDYNRADKVILDAGGLVFHTGSDGSYDVDVKPTKG